MKRLDFLVCLVVLILVEAFVKAFFDWSHLQKILWLTGEVLLLAIVCYGFLFRLILKSKLSLILKVCCLLWIIYSSLSLVAAGLDQLFPDSVLKFLSLLFPASSLLIIRFLLSYYVWVSLTSLLGFVMIKDRQGKRKKSNSKLQKVGA